MHAVYLKNILFFIVIYNDNNGLSVISLKYSVYSIFYLSVIFHKYGYVSYVTY